METRRNTRNFRRILGRALFPSGLTLHASRRAFRGLEGPMAGTECFGSSTSHERRSPQSAFFADEQKSNASGVGKRYNVWRLNSRSFITAMNPNTNTGPFAFPLARLLTPLSHLLAPCCALTHLLTHLLTLERMRMRFVSLSFRCKR